MSQSHKASLEQMQRFLQQREQQRKRELDELRAEVLFAQKEGSPARALRKIRHIQDTSTEAQLKFDLRARKFLRSLPMRFRTQTSKRFK